MTASYEYLSIGLLLLRLILGVAFFAHGTQKVFSWFGGHGPKGTHGFFSNVLKIPSSLAYVGVYAEPIASIGLIFGLMTRFAAAAMVIQMLVATYTAHRKVGFFMNWGSVAARGEGYEYTLTLAVVSFVVFLLGGGAYSIDAMF